VGVQRPIISVQRTAEYTGGTRVLATVYRLKGGKGQEIRAWWSESKCLGGSSLPESQRPERVEGVIEKE